MCGITGYVGEKEAAPILVEAMKRLEYRGYDSAGVATISDSLNVRKDVGEIDEIEESLNLSQMPGKIGIGHTRWATHGKPSQENAHPHTSDSGKIAVVHNGIVENYLELKEKLEKKGYSFESETDTEVIAHLIEFESGDFEEAARKAFKKLKGSFAVAAINLDEPDKIIASRNKSPLIIGLGKGENFIASDMPAFLKHTKKALIMQNGEYAVITKEYAEIRDIESGKHVERAIHEVNWDSESAEKSGYDHFALKEINKIPEAVEKTLATSNEIKKTAEKVKKFEKIIFVASGTSYHAALIGKHLFESVSKRMPHAVLASEFSDEFAGLIDSETLVIAISQSGETADVLSAISSAKENGAKVLGITNCLGSSITRKADFYCHTKAGPEVAVIATKTFVSQLIVLYLLAHYIAGKEVNLKKIPELQRKTLEETEDQIKDIADRIKDSKSVYFIGRGLAHPLILEGALKLKEISYIHAEGMPAGELKHGTLSLIEDGVPVVAALTQDSYDKTISNIEEVMARGGFIIAVSNENDKDIDKHSDISVKVPETEPILYPLLQIIPLQLLAYYTTVIRGLSPDKPRNLAKSVTVE